MTATTAGRSKRLVSAPLRSGVFSAALAFLASIARFPGSSFTERQCSHGMLTPALAGMDDGGRIFGREPGSCGAGGGRKDLHRAPRARTHHSDALPQRGRDDR